RDELLADLERSLLGPESFSEREVKEYYDAHRDEFKESLRHRVQVIRTGSEGVARLALDELRSGEAANDERWAQLSDKYSADRDATGPTDKAELRGDLGFVSAPGESRGENPDVPAEVRAAVFQLKQVGDIFEQPVKSRDSYYIVRLEGISPARDRAVKDAERTIRIELRRQKFIQAERQLEDDLRKKYHVTISETASKP